MTTFFVDTSTLAKRYVNEVGSRWVRSWTFPAAGHVIVISALATVEMVSLLTRRVQDGSLTASAESPLRSTFLLHVEKEYLPVLLDWPVLTSAQRLIPRHMLRALDAIQLASALDAVSKLSEPMTFVCADNRLLAAAAAEGFSTDNPLLHP
ncbi:MAG: type II toxin-antitoxin system VapC family toxin [Aggregatilineales bacterium]